MSSIHTGSSADLNWADPSELDEHFHMLTESQKQALSATHYRVRRWPHWFNRPGQDYLANLSVLIMADFAHVDQLARCGLGGRHCGLWNACEHCRYLRVKGMWNRFRTIPHRLYTRLHFVTTSPVRPLVVQEDEPADDPETIWNAVQFATWRLLKEANIDGAYVAEEWFPVAFIPQQLAGPHAHGLVLANSDAEHLKLAMEGALSDYRGEVRLSQRRFRRFDEGEDFGMEVVDRSHRWVRNIGVELPCALTVVVSSCHDGWDLKNYLEYSAKAVHWASAYRTGWLAVGADSDRTAAKDFNVSFRLGVKAWEYAIEGRRKVRGLGCFHPRHLGFLGTPKAERETKAYRSATDLWLMNVGELAWGREVSRETSDGSSHEDQCVE